MKKKANEIKEYQACWYEDDDAFSRGDMKDFRSFDTKDERDAYVDELNAGKKTGFIQLLWKSNPNAAIDFPVGAEPVRA